MILKVVNRKCGKCGGEGQAVQKIRPFNLKHKSMRIKEGGFQCFKCRSFKILKIGA